MLVWRSKFSGSTQVANQAVPRRLGLRLRAARRRGVSRWEYIRTRVEIQDATLAEIVPEHADPRYRTRRAGLDGRTRVAKRWRRLRAELVDEWFATRRREPKPGEATMLDCTADLMVEIELMRMRRQLGHDVDPATFRGTVSELRRLRMSLGIAKRVADLEREESSLGSLGEMIA
jgi:hypothetical protein